VRDLVVLGVSHHATPLPIRERLAIAAERVPADLRQLAEATGASEAVLLSTCNRVEFIASTREPHRVRDAALRYFNERGAPDRLDDAVYEHRGLDAVRHLFRVASGLDSMVLGEPQILGQVKQAYQAAHQIGATGTLLGRSFERAFRVAKRVRSETEIAAGNVSVSSIACELAERIFGDLVHRRVLLVGAGKMSEVAARSLAARGALVRVVNRDPERARALATACRGEARPLEALATELADADVVICSTAKPDFVISHELMVGVNKLRRHRPLFVIDIAVPRDVDPRVSDLPDVFLYDMDDLKRVSHENLRRREQAAQAAEVIVEAEVAEHAAWSRTLELTPTIVALRSRVRDVVAREIDKARPRLTAVAGSDPRALDALCDAIAAQLLHAPITELKRVGETDDAAKLVEFVQRLFRLDIEAVADVRHTSGADAELSPDTGGRRS
jgi:glutamyl-tRNA reductase